MKKALLTIMAATALVGIGCKDRDVDVRTDRNHKLGDARPDNGHEGFFENDGINDNLEKKDHKGVGGSGDVDNNDPIDVHREDGKVKIETEKH
jgi:hypothetical protein